MFLKLFEIFEKLFIIYFLNINSDYCHILIYLFINYLFPIFIKIYPIPLKVLRVFHQEKNKFVLTINKPDQFTDKYFKPP
jgi:hypothetical protein